MSTELSVNTLAQSVTDKVKKAIFDSIPDEKIAELINGQLNQMLSKKDKYGYSKDKSELEQLIYDELRKLLSEKVKADVSKHIEDTYQNQSKELVSAALKEMAPIFMASMMEKFSQMAIQDLKYQLQNKGLYL